MDPKILIGCTDPTDPRGLAEGNRVIYIYEHVPQHFGGLMTFQFSLDSGLLFRE